MTLICFFLYRSIFGVWPGSGFVGRRGSDQVAAAYTVHGPRTSLILARPLSSSTKSDSPSTDSDSQLIVQEYWLINDQWILQRDNIKVPETKKIFAPANLRASAENSAYAELVQYWMHERYTLRYSGGMVPDVHHILAKVRFFFE